jgi:murein DD-endopeptidase MepM/ murein hydrolase activator NlpD
MLVREFRRFRETVKAIFPDRQIFVRTDGTVKFVTFSTTVQVLMACVLFVIAGWIGLTTGNFLLKDRIVAAKDARIQHLASDYDTLNDEMLRMQQGVVSSVDELKNRQQLLDSLVQKNDLLARQIDSHPDLSISQSSDTSGGTASGSTQDRPDAVGADAAPDVTAPDTGIDVEPEQSAAPSPESAAFPGDQWWQFASAGEVVIPTIRRAPKPGDPRWERYVEENIDTIKSGQDKVASKLLSNIRKQYAQLEGLVDVTGLTPDKLLAALDQPVGGQGGPEVGLKFPSPISTAAAASIDDGDEFATVADAVNRLDGLQASLLSMPLAKPVTDYYISSPFGKRRDPFSGNWAFHSGLDMAGYWKEPVHATVPGTVTFVGQHGPYGRMVEIDHGNGFKTRFGHLNSISVKKGEKVTRGQVIGLMGNTGRSTGTHLHYEIWFNDKLQNPLKFFRAASYAIQE